jgi:signal transduction histidine kinase
MCLLTDINILTDEIAEVEGEIFDRQHKLKLLKATKEKLEKVLIEQMQEDGVLAYEQDGFLIKINEPRGAIELLVDAKDLPAQYQRVKIEADKIAIKKALENGELHNMARITRGEPSLTIKAK